MGYGELSNTQETMVMPLLQMKNIRGKPYITVSAKGMINGLSNIPNDGADFGPDTTSGATAPGQYGSPYTETLGLQEVLNYWKSNPSVKIVIAPGVYDITDAPFQSFTNQLPNSPSTIYCQLLIPLPTTSVSPIPWFGLSIKGNPVMSVGPPNSLNASEAVIIYSGATTTSTTYDHYIMAAQTNPNNTASGYTDFVNLDIDLSFHVSAGSNLGGFWGGGLSSISSDYLEAIVENLTSTPNTAAGIVFNTVFGESYINKLNVMGYENGIIIGNGHMVVDFYQTYFNGSAIWLWSNSGAYPTVFNVIDYQNTSYLFSSNHGGGPFTNNYLNIGTVGIGDISSVPITTLFYWTSVYSFFITVGSINSGVSLTPSLLSNIPSGSGIVKISSILPAVVPTTPSIPSSGTAQENTNPYAVDVYVYGGDVTEIQITRGGTANTVFSVSTAIAMSGQGYRLNPGDSITVTYSTAPSWEWLAN